MPSCDDVSYNTWPKKPGAMQRVGRIDNIEIFEIIVVGQPTILLKLELKYYCYKCKNSASKTPKLT